MWEARHRAAGELHRFLRSAWEKKEETSDVVFLFENEIQVQMIREGHKSPLDTFWNGQGVLFIAEKKPVKIENGEQEEPSADESHALQNSLQEISGPIPLSVHKARQLLSSYIMAHNPNMDQLSIKKPVAVLPPLWVRCDSSDPEGTCWLGAEPIKTSINKFTGINTHVVSCKGPMSEKLPFASLEDLKRIHKGQHHSSVTMTKGFAQYDLFGSTTVENSIIESQSNVLVDFMWNMVDKILQKPPSSSTAALNIQVESGDQRSPVYQVYRELDFLLALAKGLKTGVTGWPEPLETRSAVDLVQELLNDLKSKLDGVNNTVNTNEAENLKGDVAAVERDVQAFSTERGDLDFTEQLWCRMRKSVTSYQDVVDCFTLVIQSLKHGDVQPWIHRGSSSSLSRIIQQSYSGTMEPVSLTGLAPIRMLLEIGLDKMKKDYINCFIGQELATLNYLDYFISTSVDLQEQVHRVRKLHHMLEIVVVCSVFLSLGHENLFPLTQSCIKYYKENPWNEKHVFQLPVRQSVVSSFYQHAHPQTWRVEIISGHGQNEVKTIWQLSSKPPMDHVVFDMPDVTMENTVIGDSDETLYCTTLVTCSQLHFT
ncbi:protein zwilch homolog isoform X2 [Lissotriton helveticus]